MYVCVCVCGGGGGGGGGTAHSKAAPLPYPSLIPRLSFSKAWGQGHPYPWEYAVLLLANMSNSSRESCLSAAGGGCSAAEEIPSSAS